MNMPLQIRQTDRKDMCGILQVNRHSTPNVSAMDKQYFETLLNESDFFHVAQIDQKIVGYVCALRGDANYCAEEFSWFQRMLHENFLYIDQVAIHAKFRRKGVAAALYQALDEYAFSHQITSLVCEVNFDPINAESLSLHKKLGFIEVGKMHARGMVVSMLHKNLFI